MSSFWRLSWKHLNIDLAGCVVFSKFIICIEVKAQACWKLCWYCYNNFAFFRFGRVQEIILLEWVLIQLRCSNLQRSSATFPFTACRNSDLNLCICLLVLLELPTGCHWLEQDHRRSAIPLDFKGKVLNDLRGFGLDPYIYLIHFNFILVLRFKHISSRL